MAALLSATAAALALHLVDVPRPQSQLAPASCSSRGSLATLLNMPSGELSLVSTVRVNLLCAEGLALETPPDIAQCESTISTWAERVKSETERHFYRFRADPAQFENSEGFFRMLMLSVVLAEDFRVHYCDDLKRDSQNASAADHFFANPETVFLHGLLGPHRAGTCSSMPALYAAVGRELGYPLKLVTTKAHLFVRWDGRGERFNIEATSRGLNCFKDDYYRHWPFEITPAEENAEGYLKSLTPAQELAVFVSIRGMCLRELGRIPEAADAFAAAVRLAPNCRGYRSMLADLNGRLGPQRQGPARKSTKSEQPGAEL